ncbi:MAG: hypothetical protein DRH24_09765 [Deltaproteobacteria bacterium]|nr:MAG: hypothetical protein DRH24_09765 [Deltaproteobacteria bacterium]
MRSTVMILLLSFLWSGLFLCLGIFGGWITLSVSSEWLIHPVAALYRHLRLSMVPFGCLFVLYFFLVHKIRISLKNPETELSELTYYDRLLNTTISMFFGVGVIWTAVGMETALMQALDGINQGQEAIAELSAFGLLERLVNGGLLLALSTTIFGGVCGYMFRLLKVVFLGKNWDRFILQEARTHGPISTA